MDGFVASVVIAALAIIALAGFTRLGVITDVHLPNGSGSLAIFAAIRRA
jgi:hypothetical protein